MYLPAHASLVFFDVGSQSLSNLPIVLLQPKSEFFGGQQEYIFAMLWRISEVQFDLLRELAKSERMYSFILSTSVGLFVVGSVLAFVLYWFPQLDPVFWLHQRRIPIGGKVLATLCLLLIRIAEFCGEFFKYQWTEA